MMKRRLASIAALTAVCAVAPAAAFHADAGEPPLVVRVNDGRGCIDSDQGGGFQPNPGSTLGYSFDQIVVSVNPGNCPQP
jgi:hypothetical protein